MSTDTNTPTVPVPVPAEVTGSMSADNLNSTMTQQIRDAVERVREDPSYRETAEFQDIMTRFQEIMRGPTNVVPNVEEKNNSDPKTNLSHKLQALKARRSRKMTKQQIKDKSNK